jgi:hypothetical protein
MTAFNPPTQLPDKTAQVRLRDTFLFRKLSFTPEFKLRMACNLELTRGPLHIQLPDKQHRLVLQIDLLSLLFLKLSMCFFYLGFQEGFSMAQGPSCVIIKHQFCKCWTNHSNQPLLLNTKRQK